MTTISTSERQQAKAFTSWLNDKLSCGGREELCISDDTLLFQHLADGLFLVHVLEVLYGHTIDNYNRNPSLPIQKLDNLSIAVDFIRHNSPHIKLVNVHANDILSGNVKIILGVLWQLVLLFQIHAHHRTPVSSLLTLDNANGEAGATVPFGISEHDQQHHVTLPPTHGGEAGEHNHLHEVGAQGLLAWVNQVLQSTDSHRHELFPRLETGMASDDEDDEKVCSFRDQWRDGKLLLRVVSTLTPAGYGVRPVDFIARSATPEQRCQAAFEWAQREHAIPALLHASDVVQHCDHRSFMTYLAVLREEALNGGTRRRTRHEQWLRRKKGRFLFLSDEDMQDIPVSELEQSLEDLASHVEQLKLQCDDYAEPLSIIDEEDEEDEEDEDEDGFSDSDTRSVSVGSSQAHLTTIQEVAVTQGVIGKFTRLCVDHSDRAEILTGACRVMVELTEFPEHSGVAVEFVENKEAVGHLLENMQRHKQHAEYQSEAVALIENIVESQPAVVEEFGEQFVEHVMNAMEEHMQEPVIQVNCVNTLDTLGKASVSVADDLVFNGSIEGAIAAIRRNPQDDRLAEAVVRFLNRLAERGHKQAVPPDPVDDASDVDGISDVDGRSPPPTHGTQLESIAEVPPKSPTPPDADGRVSSISSPSSPSTRNPFLRLRVGAMVLVEQDGECVGGVVQDMQDESLTVLLQEGQHQRTVRLPKDQVQLETAAQRKKRLEAQKSPLEHQVHESWHQAQLAKRSLSMVRFVVGWGKTLGGDVDKIRITVHGPMHTPRGSLARYGFVSAASPLPSEHLKKGITYTLPVSCITDRGDGKYPVEFYVPHLGVYQVRVFLYGKESPISPFSFVMRRSGSRWLNHGDPRYRYVPSQASMRGFPSSWTMPMPAPHDAPASSPVPTPLSTPATHPPTSVSTKRLRRRIHLRKNKKNKSRDASHNNASGAERESQPAADGSSDARARTRSRTRGNSSVAPTANKTEQDMARKHAFEASTLEALADYQRNSQKELLAEGDMGKAAAEQLQRDQQLLSRFLPIATVGHKFKKYSFHRGISHVPKVVWLCVTPAKERRSSRKNRMQVATKDTDSLLVRKGIITWGHSAKQYMSVESVTAVVGGKHTQTFRRKAHKNVLDDVCFSIVCTQRTLDLETETVIERDYWVKALNLLFGLKSSKSPQALILKLQDDVIRTRHRDNSNSVEGVVADDARVRGSSASSTQVVTSPAGYTSDGAFSDSRGAGTGAGGGTAAADQSPLFDEKLQQAFAGTDVTVEYQSPQQTTPTGSVNDSQPSSAQRVRSSSVPGPGPTASALAQFEPDSESQPDSAPSKLMSIFTPLSDGSGGGGAVELAPPLDSMHSRSLSASQAFQMDAAEEKHEPEMDFREFLAMERQRASAEVSPPQPVPPLENRSRLRSLSPVRFVRHGRNKSRHSPSTSSTTSASTSSLHKSVSAQHQHHRSKSHSVDVFPHAPHLSHSSSSPPPGPVHKRSNSKRRSALSGVPSGLPFPPDDPLFSTRITGDS